MKTLYIKIISLFIIGLSISACGGQKDENTPPSGIVIESGNLVLEVNGITRNLDYATPQLSSYPLVIAFHGGGDSLDSFEKYAEITPLVKRERDFGVVYPEGINKHWNDGRAESGSTADDIAFIQAIINTYKAKGVNRFYLIGMSNGAMIVQRAACELADEVSGIMIISATQSSWLQTNCMDNTTPLPALFAFGDDDRSFINNLDIITPGFPVLTRGTHIGINATIDYWLTRNGCLATLNDLRSLNVVSEDNTQVNIKEGTNCNAQTLYYEIAGGGHRWPDPSGSNTALTTGLLGYASYEISTAEEMVNFFGL